MTSFINLFIYEILGPKSNTVKYSFNPLSLRKNSNNNTPIIPKNLKKENIKINKVKIFSKDIIKNYKKNTKEIYSGIRKLEYNKELNININDIKLFSKIYKTFPARITLTEILPISSFLNEIYYKVSDLVLENAYILNDYFTSNTTYEIKNNNSEIIYNLQEDDNSNIIVIGDNHSSFHSFFRIILRLYMQGIITDGYKLKENYKLILLGDLIDRGNYSIELLYILLNLMKTNNTKAELKVILIRGNHEEESTYTHYGFNKEFIKKIKDSKAFKDKINYFFKYCPSAIVLNHLKTRYWLCHGGFSTDISKYQQIKNNEAKKIYVNELKKYEISQIRWNDFSGIDKDGSSVRGPDLKTIGYNTLQRFLNEYNLDFIIRGHDDNESNAMLLMKYNKQMFFYLNDKSNMEYYNENKNENKNKNNIIQYKTFNKSNKSNKEILSINSKGFKSLNKQNTEPKFGIEIGSIKLFPVLTISNNCDIERTQYSDSFIIISKSTMNNKKNIINNRNSNVTNVTSNVT